MATLRQYRILDTPPEPTFDELARLAAYACDAPTAVITLVDAERQWFKARVNLEIPETAREIAFCAHTIARSSAGSAERAAAVYWVFMARMMTSSAPNDSSPVVCSTNSTS